MKVHVKYIDDESIAPEEVKAQVRKLFGPTASVSIYPDSSDPFSLLYFALQHLITERQVTSLLDDGLLYQTKVEELKKESLILFEEAFLEVVKDNEYRLKE